MTISAVISGSGLFTPPDSISNQELVESFNTWVDRYNEAHHEAIERGELAAKTHSSVAFIEKASGIKSRYVIDKKGILDPDRMVPAIPERANTSHSVMCEIACHAAQEALDQAGVVGADIDAVIVAASNLQRAYPAIAIEVQAALGATGFAFDMNVACSSATFGIQQASDAVRSGSARRVLMVNPEICTGHLNFRDRDSHFIFGDVATAVVIERALKPPKQALAGTYSIHAYKRSTPIIYAIISASLIALMRMASAKLINYSCKRVEKSLKKSAPQSRRKLTSS